MTTTKNFGCLKCGWNISATPPNDFHTELYSNKQYGDYIEMEFPCLNASCKHVNKRWWGRPESR
jgi:hypothetical protein